MIRIFSKIIQEICNENNIKISRMSDDWIMELKKGGKTRYILGYKFDLNSSCTSEICNDKYALFSILENSAIPVIKQNILFKNNDEKMLELLMQYNNNVVIKPNQGTCGENVFHITSKEDAINVYKNLIVSGNVCICPFYNIKNEYRAIYLDNKIVYMYKKVKPILVGDGKKSIKELLIDFNSIYYSNSRHYTNEKYNLDYIPKKDEIIEYEWRFNLSKGAIIEDISYNHEFEPAKIAMKAAEKINLKFGSIDIIQTMEGEYKIIEINSGVMMENLVNLKSDGYNLAKGIYEKAVLKLFE